MKLTKHVLSVCGQKQKQLYTKLPNRNSIKKAFRVKLKAAMYKVILGTGK